jgi:hypothetical protein
MHERGSRILLTAGMRFQTKDCVKFSILNRKLDRSTYAVSSSFAPRSPAQGAQGGALSPAKPAKVRPLPAWASSPASAAETATAAAGRKEGKGKGAPAAAAAADAAKGIGVPSRIGEPMRERRFIPEQATAIAAATRAANRSAPTRIARDFLVKGCDYADAGNTRDEAIVMPSKLTEIDLDGGLASSTTSNGGAHSLALPLLSADSFYRVDAGVAARAALSAVQQFLAKHPADAALRIVFVEEAGSAGARALRQHNTVTDPRLVLLTSNDPKAIVQLGERGVPCAYIAVEADKLFYKGKRPLRSRSQHVYDKSGKEESAGATALGAATSARYTTAGKLGEAYDVTLASLKKSAPLLTVAKCHTVIHVIVPSRNANHKLEDCYVKDDVECWSILEKCYTSLLDNFSQLSGAVDAVNPKIVRQHPACVEGAVGAVAEAKSVVSEGVFSEDEDEDKDEEKCDQDACESEDTAKRKNVGGFRE